MLEYGYTLCVHEMFNMKDAGLRIRLEPKLRDEFIQTCHERHVSAAQVLREFMRHYVKCNMANKETDSSSTKNKLAT